MHQDAEIVAAVKAGDKERYAELIERYQGMVYAIAWSRLGDATLCEDAAQETLIKAFRYLSALRRPEKFAAWLARIARNVTSTAASRHRRELAGRERWRLEHLAAAQPAPDSDERPLCETVHP